MPLLGFLSGPFARRRQWVVRATELAIEAVLIVIAIAAAAVLGWLVLSC